jgi:hypothetical protein
MRIDKTRNGSIIRLEIETLDLERAWSPRDEWGHNGPPLTDDETLFVEYDFDRRIYTVSRADGESSYRMLDQDFDGDDVIALGPIGLLFTLLVEHDLTDAALADLLGVTRQSVHGWRSGRTINRITQLALAHLSRSIAAT